MKKKVIAFLSHLKKFRQRRKKQRLTRVESIRVIYLLDIMR